jgi:hypothetical protein
MQDKIANDKPGSDTNNPELVKQAPEKMPEIVRAMHSTAAQALEDAATMLEHEMQSHIALMREEAQTLRAQGENQANTIEALSLLIRDTHKTFQVQADKLASFRAGEQNGTQGSVEDLDKIYPTPTAPPALSDQLNERIAKELSKLPRG